MQKIKFCLFFALLVVGFGFMVQSAHAATYYVSTIGNDSNPGTQSQPWKTIAKVNSRSFSPGDSVLFKKGETWREQLIVPSSGSAGNPITFGAYGSGDNPIIDGSNIFSSWTSESLSSTNLLANPENFNASWSKYRVSVNVDAVIDPGGVQTADGIVATDVNNTHTLVRYPTVSAETTYTFSVYAKPGVSNWVGIELEWADSGWSDLRVDKRFFNISTGALGFTDGSATWAITSAANGFYRISGTATAPALTANLALQIYITNADETWIWAGDNSSNYTYLAWAKFEVGSLTNYQATTAYYATCTTEPKQVFQGTTRLTKASAKASMPAGSFWFDSGNSRLYIRTSGDDDPAGYTITASQRNDGIVIDTHDYVTISNLDITKTNLDGIGNWTSTGTVIDSCNISYNYEYGINEWRVSGTEVMTITNNTVHHNGGSGMEPNSLSSSTISHNTVYNNDILDIESYHLWGGGIKLVGPRNTNNTIEYNKVYLNGTGTTGAGGDSKDRTGIWLDTVGAGNIVRYNLVYSNLKYGIFIEDADSNQVYYNIVYSHTEATNARGILVGRGSSNNLVYNNVSYGNNYGLAAEGDNSVSGVFQNNIFKNNISTGNTLTNFRATGGGENDGTNGSGNIYTYNALGPEASNFIEWGSGVYKSTYAAWETAYGATTRSVQSDPLFVNPTGPPPDFHLQSISPAINAGVDVGLTQDYKGISVPQGSAPEIGAYEYVGTPADTTPPSVPTGLTATTISSSQINLSWTASTDPTVSGQVTSGLVGYRVYRGGTQIATVTTTSYSDTGLSPSTTYTYTVAAYDAAGNVSIQSTSASATTQTPADTVPPSRFNKIPSASLNYKTIEALIGLNTDENAICRYSSVAGTAYSSMTLQFNSGQANTSHFAIIPGLTSNSSSNYYVKCQDTKGNANTDDFTITATVSNDTTVPTRTNNFPRGNLSKRTTQVILSLNTDEPSTCKYSIKASTAYSSMTSTFTNTGGLTHSTPITGLTMGTTYKYYVRCQDVRGNANTNDFTISFTVSSSVASSETPDQTLAMAEEPPLQLTSPLSYGSQSEEVTFLQQILSKINEIYPERLITGFFGNLTQKAVQKFQCEYGIVCEGDTETTGHGMVGPKTRGIINELMTASVIQGE